MIKISIIVPVYNTEKHIQKCLESLLKQTTKQELEILLINDGSKDNSEQVIKEYMERKPNANIKYFLKKNEGIAKTRNFGIEKASGKYILFVDSDDYISSDTIKKLEPYIEQDIDIIKFKLQRVDETGKILEKVNGPVFNKVTGQEAFNKLYSNDILLDSPCIYLIKRDLFIKNNLKFKRKYHEDFGLIPLVILTANSVVSLPYYCYQYLQGQNSITRNEDYNKTLNRIEDVLYHYDNMTKEIEKMNLDEITKENIRIYYTNAIILKVKELKKEDQNKLIKEIKKRKMENNIKTRDLKQLIKKLILKINIKLYLKMR